MILGGTWTPREWARRCVGKPRTSPVENPEQRPACNIQAIETLIKPLHRNPYQPHTGPL